MRNYIKKKPLLFLIGLYIAFYYFVLIFLKETNLALVGGNILSAFAAFSSTMLLFLAVRRQDTKAGRAFWLLLFTGSFSYFIAEMIWIYNENLLKKDVLFPGYPDIFYMLQIVFYFFALSFLLLKIKRPAGAVRNLFDATIVMVVSATFSWHFFLEPIIADPEASGLFLFFSLGYPIGDLVLLFGTFALYLGTGSSFFKKGLYLFVVGMFIQITADSIYAYLVSSSTYTSGSMIDPLYALALLMVGAAGQYNKGNILDLEAVKASHQTNHSALFRMYVPYISIFMLSVFVFRHNPNDPMFTFGSALALLLVMIRQLLILAENRKLLQQFEVRTQELAINEQRYRSLFDFHSDAVFSLDMDAHFTSVNSSCGGMIGYTETELMGKSMFSIVDKSNELHFRNYLEKTKLGNPQNFELAIPGKNGQNQFVSFSTIPMRVNEQVVGIYGIGRDITEKKEYEQRVTHMAYHDLLTGLPNRSHFEHLLTNAITDLKQKEQKHAVIFIDLDRFKVINDTLGHQVGDQLLIAVAKRLEFALRSRDIVARQGGDEFTLLAKDISHKKDAAVIAEKIIAHLNAPFLINGHDLRITSSIGVAVYPADGVTAVDLMKNADVAMYEAKEQGKNGYSFYTAQMNEEPSRKLLLEKDLHVAIEHNELSLHYQPQIDTKTQGITGAEALLRWNHPILGMISPAEFIPIAEQTGLIMPIGQWILRSATEQGKKWLDMGYNLKIGVNLSPRQFYQEDLVGMIQETLHETGLPPENLDLEITEGIAMNDLDMVVPNLMRLRELGIKVSIDDFGTGYSSLSYLSAIPIDTLKIAREFVDKVGVDKGNEAIIASIIAMAKNLNLDVIAEGVETESQSIFLQKLDCNLMQGYWYSRPLRVEDLEGLLFKEALEAVK